MKKKISIYFFINICLFFQIGCFMKYNIFLYKKFGFIKIDIIAVDDDINYGIRLPVDIIISKNADQVLELTPDEWFAHPKRYALMDDELYQLAVHKGYKRSIEISVTSDIKKIIIYADYDRNDDFESQRIILPVENCYYGVLIGKYKIRLIKKTLTGCFW